MDVQPVPTKSTLKKRPVRPVIIVIYGIILSVLIILSFTANEAEISDASFWFLAVIITVLFIYFSHYSPDNKRQRYLLLHGEKLTAVVGDSHLRQTEWLSLRRTLGFQYQFNVLVTFEYKGQHYQSSTQMIPIEGIFPIILPTNGLLEKGDHVNIYVDPHNVENFIIYEISNYQFT